jgi:dihydropteroate synthase
LELLRGLEELRRLRFPVVVGLSRKSFLGNILGLGVNDRLHASLAAAVKIGRQAAPFATSARTRP